MPLTKAQKAETIEKVKKMAASAKAVVLTDFKGITVEDVTNLRRKVRKAKGDFAVVKNTFSRKIFADPAHEPLRQLMRGPTALAFAQEDAVEIFKVLSDFAKDSKTLTIKAGLMDGAVVNAAQIAAIATLPPKPQLLAMLMGWMNSPTASLLGVMNAQIADFLYLLKGIEEKKAGEAPAAPPAS